MKRLGALKTAYDYSVPSLISIEISSIGSKEQKDISNSCRKCIDLASEIAKVSFKSDFFFKISI